ncbi:VWA domain-containing protein [Patescibacteria group bacterium]|nr:VWA domain-containing protein [Patescibacteria group bacterium]
MPLSWSTKRRVIYISSAIFVLAILMGGFLFVSLYEPPTYFDGKQNQDELGIDCGGSSKYLCPFQVTDPVVLFVRAFEVVPGVYNTVAYIENANFNAGVRNFGYTFKLLDVNNAVIATRRGRSFLTPGSISPIFENTIETQGNIPVRTFFEFEGELKWSRIIPKEGNPLSVKSRVLKNADTLPRIDAVIENSSVFEIPDVEIIAVVFNALGNAIAASRTFVDFVPRRSTVNVVFTWPTPFSKELEACIAPVDVMLLIDTSGSMNDDGLDPPQPLTDAKAAAEDFVERLSSNDRSGLVTFATKSFVDQKLTSQHGATKAAISFLDIKPEEEVGFTNIGDALLKALDELDQSINRIREDGQSFPNRRVTVLLTDGLANAPEDPGGEPYAEEAAQKAQENGVNLFTIGLGDDVNTEFLARLAGSREQYYQAATSRDLDGIYRQISDAICERGPAVIEIIPRTTDVF